MLRLRCSRTWPPQSRATVEAQLAAAELYSRGEGAPQDMQEAAHWQLEAAARGSPEAQCPQRPALHPRVGVLKDDATALHYFRDFRARRNAQAAFILGVLYETGESGVQENMSEALRWYHVAAENGEPGAQYALGERYAQGRGVEASRDEALRWSRLAAQQGHEDARRNLERLEAEAASDATAKGTP